MGEAVASNRTIRACLCAMLLASSVAVAARKPSDEDTTSVRFKLYHDYLVVMQGSLGKLDKRNILVDTGTNPTMIDEEVARKLGLQPITDSDRALHVLQKDLPSHFVRLPSLAFGPVHRDDMAVVVTDLSVFQRVAGVHVDAVVGLDVLAQSSFRIDYAAKRIVFGPVDANPRAVPFGSGPPFVTIPMVVKDQRLQVLIDTGTAALVLFSNRVGDWQNSLPVVSQRNSSNVGGQVAMREVEIGETRVGSIAEGPRSAFITENHCCKFDGLMGISSKNVKEIAFDFERKQFSWRLRDADESPLLENPQKGGCDLQSGTPGWVNNARRGAMALSESSDGDVTCPARPKMPARAN
jgi:hypothetical protein